LLKQTVAAQEAQEYACHKSLALKVSEISASIRTDGNG